MKQLPRGPMVVRPPGSFAPIPVNPETSLTREAEENLATVARDMYDGDEIEFLGRTRLEVALLSLAKDSSHDPDARTEFLDRVMGKPKFRSENLNVNMDLHGFLSRLAEQDAEVIDAEVVVDEPDFLT